MSFQDDEMETSKVKTKIFDYTKREDRKDIHIKVMTHWLLLSKMNKT